MPPTILIAGLLLASSLAAQTVPSVTYGSIYTPEIHLGSATEPTTVTVPPVIELSSEAAEPEVSNAPPASTALLATRHFDFVVSPVSGVDWPGGTMADTSVSLGEYARQLRAQKKNAATQSAPLSPAPDSMSQPTR